MSEPDDVPDSYLAARYALGVAGREEIAEAERRLAGDPAFALEVARFDAVFGVLGDGVAEVKPPAGLWDRIEQTLDDEIAAPGTRTVRASNVAWEAFIEGIERKILFVDAGSGISGVLYRLQAGAGVGMHGHGVIEECLVIEGEIEIGGLTIRAGDMHLAFPGVRHGPLFSPYGAVVYIRGDIEMQA